MDNATMTASPLRVLVADDDRCVAATLTEILRHEGHDARSAYSGAEALTKARAFRPDVIVLDIAMPGLTGYGVASALKQEYGGRAPRLIAVSGLSDPADRLLSALIGFEQHFVKPYDARAVLAAIAGASG
jgi:CheY-like chemotaxis protein